MMDDDRQLTIGALADATGCKADTIRYYERIALLPKPTRTAARYRRYGQGDIDRLSFIRRSRELGFTIEEIKDLLMVSSDPSRECTRVDEIASRHLAEIRAKVVALQAIETELARLRTECRGGSVGECRIVKALAQERKARRVAG